MLQWNSSRGFPIYDKNGGIDTDQSYPYDGHKQQCRYDPNDSGASVKRYVQMREGNQTALTQAIATIGPIAVAINSYYIQYYKGGYFYYRECDSPERIREILAVGRTRDEWDDYYIIKNSWVTSWGENGYIKFGRNSGNLRGVASESGYPIV